MSWTEEKVAKLKELWGKGSTASQIAEIIGGISRNAVIGKAHRLNLSAKIKTRAATSNQNFENSLESQNTKTKRGRKTARFRPPDTLLKQNQATQLYINKKPRNFNLAGIMFLF